MESDEYYRQKYLKYKAKYIRLVGGKQDEALILTKQDAIQSIYNPAEPIVIKNCREFVKLFLTSDGAVKAHLMKLNKMSPVTQQSKFCEPVDKMTLGKILSTVTKKTQELATEGLKKGLEVSKEAYKYMEPTLKEIGKEVGQQLKETGKVLGEVAKDVANETSKSLTTTIGTSGQALATSAASAAKSGTQQLQLKIDQKTQQGVSKIQQSSAPKPPQAPPMPQQRPPPPFAVSLQKQKGLLKSPSPQPMQRGGGLDKASLSTLLKDVPNVNIDNILETMQKFSYDMIIRVKFGKPMPDKQGTVTLEFLPVKPSLQVPKPIANVPKYIDVALDTPNPFN
jgi:hypothetical protein